jgi:hypothetical protein
MRTGTNTKADGKMVKETVKALSGFSITKRTLEEDIQEILLMIKKKAEGLCFSLTKTGDYLDFFLTFFEKNLLTIDMMVFGRTTNLAEKEE